MVAGELADRSGISRAGVSAIETGRLVPSTAAALALAAAFGCTVEALFRLPGARPVEEEASWAWPAVTDSCRYWRAEVRRPTPGFTRSRFPRWGCCPTTGCSRAGAFTTTRRLIRRGRWFWDLAIPPWGCWPPSSCVGRVFG